MPAYDQYDRKGFISCQLCDEEFYFECCWRGCDSCDPYYDSDQTYVGRVMLKSPFCDRCYNTRGEEIRKMVSTRKNVNGYLRWEKRGKMGPPVGLVHTAECDGDMWHRRCKLQCVDRTHLCLECGNSFCNHPHADSEWKVVPSPTKNICQDCFLGPKT